MDVAQRRTRALTPTTHKAHTTSHTRLRMQAARAFHGQCTGAVGGSVPRSEDGRPGHHNGPGVYACARVCVCVFALMRRHSFSSVMLRTSPASLRRACCLSSMGAAKAETLFYQNHRFPFSGRFTTNGTGSVVLLSIDKSIESESLFYQDRAFPFFVQVLERFGNRLLICATEIDTRKERWFTSETDPDLMVCVARVLAFV